MDPYPAKDVLNTLLAVEALLVAASTLAATTAQPPADEVSPKDYGPYRIARGVAILMCIVTVGGINAWIEVFITDDKGIEGFSDLISAISLAAPLLGIPVFGFIAASWAKPG